MNQEENPLLQMSLQELWQLFPINLTPHNPLWKEWYEEEHSFLLKQLSCDEVVRLSHIGSTAVEGIQAKPIVDMLLEVKKDSSFQKLKEVILQSGYLCMNETNDRISFNKGYTINGFAERVFHLHLRYEGDNDELYFCDELQAHPSIAKDYETLKLSLWKPFQYDRDAYTAHKTDFIKRYTLIAKEEFKGKYENNRPY
ncbi:GrpB family protein [Capnocytophaga sputigena]|uniref:GrpB family protein n=1 Tax=Capnocytophaga sputigena TaxID=1019 RepID=UPI000BB1BF50|nr:GrpB family protein [Capnocytophaga sputigena]ATA70188.1 hypothetical protein CGC57_04365 [Capnocytophaga sputigena]